MKDLKGLAPNLKEIECHLGNSLILSLQKDSFLKRLQENLQFEVRPNSKQVLFFNELRKLLKLTYYAKSQEVHISDKLKDLIQKNRTNCSATPGDKLKQIFYDLLQLELFLKSRYPNFDHKGRVQNSVRSSYELLRDSVDGQITHEYFW